MADEDDEDQVKQNAIPKYKLLYQDPEISIRMPALEGEERLPTEEKKEEKQETNQKPIDIIMQSKINLFNLLS